MRRRVLPSQGAEIDVLRHDHLLGPELGLCHAHQLRQALPVLPLGVERGRECRGS